MRTTFAIVPLLLRKKKGLGVTRLLLVVQVADALGEKSVRVPPPPPSPRPAFWQLGANREEGFGQVENCPLHAPHSKILDPSMVRVFFYHAAAYIIPIYRHVYKHNGEMGS